MESIAVFGIGSTNFRRAVGTTDGELLTDIRTDPTNHDDLVGQILSALRQFGSDGWSPSAAAISCAGLVDTRRGRIELMHTPHGEPINDLDVAGAIADSFDLPTYLRNDCTTAVIGEAEFGAGRDFETIVHVTIGTGIGGGVVDHGRVLQGEHGHAGEVGYLPVATDSELSVAGVAGAWEAHCSGRGIPTFVDAYLQAETRASPLREADEVTAERLYSVADEGDPVACELLDRIDRLNATGIAAIANLYDPGLITLGGGIVINNENRVVEGVTRSLDQFSLGDPPDVRVTPLGGDIGIHGAMALPTWSTAD